jgi:hypothetical protein
MSIEANKAAIRREVEDWHLPGVLDEIADPDLTFIAPGWPTTHGLENVKKLSAFFFAGLSERRLTVEEMIGEGDTVAVSYTVRSTNRGSLPSPDGTVVIPAGKTVTSTGMSIIQLRGGRVLSERTQLDWLPRLSAAR